MNNNNNDKGSTDSGQGSKSYSSSSPQDVATSDDKWIILEDYTSQDSGYKNDHNSIKLSGPHNVFSCGISGKRMYNNFIKNKNGKILYLGSCCVFRDAMISNSSVNAAICNTNLGQSSSQSSIKLNILELQLFLTK